MLRSAPPVLRSATPAVRREPPPSDGELMRGVVGDDPRALPELYDRHAAAVYGLARRILRDITAADDVTQEAFVALWRSGHTYRPERGSVRSWLLTITRNRAIEVIRRDRSSLRAELDTDEREAAERTDEQALAHLDALTIGVALRAIPAAQRQVLELGYFEGLTHREIAAHVGIPLGTVKGRMRLGLRALGHELGSSAAML